MPALLSTQRTALEKTVIAARRHAETGARNALLALAVDHSEPYGHTTPDQRALRNRLRAKARLLGDALHPNGRQDIDRLTYELAYEYWHRMLFARFLEANHLLMHPSGVAVSMDECAELAPEEGYADKWAAATAYAARMLPAIFRPDDPLMQIDFAAEDRIRLETLLDAVPHDTFTADDSLGWVYQFWQNEAKAAINKSEAKIDGARLPAVTQLFTEPYMVQFLIDNTIGAWWTSRHPGETPPLKFEYLRFSGQSAVSSGQSAVGSGQLAVGGGQAPAAGNFEGWPDRTAGITALDPCMGSGHFIAALFSVLAVLRMHEEGLSREAAADRVIAENLHGLELDPRCTQIAAFNLALTAWKFCGSYKPLPPLNLACSGLAPKGKIDDWTKLARSESEPAKKQRLEYGLEEMYRLFQQAPELGSLLDPTAIRPDAFRASFAELQPYLEHALALEPDQDLQERGVLAAGIAQAGRLLAQSYTLIITNVPYLARGKQAETLARFCQDYYPDAKGDLATVFLERMLKMTATGGTACSVMPQNWLFLTSYKKFRERLLKTKSWSMVARLGPKGFQTPMWDFNVMLISIQNTKPLTEHTFPGLDVSDAPNAAEKDAALRSAEIVQLNQQGQLGNPDARVVVGENSEALLMNKYATGLQGISPADFLHYGRNFWENGKIQPEWYYWQSTVSITKPFSGRELLLWWGADLVKAFESGQAYIRGQEAWTKKGIVVRQVRPFPVTLYCGDKFDTNCAIIVPNNESHLPAIWCFCSSPKFNEEVRKIDQKLNVTNATLVKVPFDLEYWQKVAAEKYPDGLPQPYSDNPTQWLFHGHPVRAERPLQVALARLLGYRWPAESDAGMELSAEARRLIGEVQAFNALSDEDGIVCLPPVNGEYAAAERLRAFLQAVYGDAWSNAVLAQLLAQEGSKKANLEDWLREECFEQHCKLFHQRPFLWHIWDGRKDGFSAIVNYHLLSREGLQKLIYTYLGDWLHQCEARVQRGDSGADGQLLAAQQLKGKLEAILEGEPPYDIFVRWKPIEQQSLGWDPDLNDGVRLNIRPFVLADVLRKKPNIKWGVDRGKNPPGSPWGEVRDNDRHLGLVEKRAGVRS